MVKLVLGKINWSVTAILAIGWVVLIGALPQDVVVQRRRQMESNNSVVAEALNKAVKEKNFVEIEDKCNVIQENMNKVLDFFPRGSLSKTPGPNRRYGHSGQNSPNIPPL